MKIQRLPELHQYSKGYRITKFISITMLFILFGKMAFSAISGIEFSKISYLGFLLIYFLMYGFCQILEYEEYIHEEDFSMASIKEQKERFPPWLYRLNLVEAIVGHLYILFLIFG